jgi:hypothetical protein
LPLRWAMSRWGMPWAWSWWAMRFSVVRLHADHGDVAEEIPALVPGLEAVHRVGDLVADGFKLPEGRAGSGAAAGFGQGCFLSLGQIIAHSSQKT